MPQVSGVFFDANVFCGAEIVEIEKTPDPFRVSTCNMVNPHLSNRQFSLRDFMTIISGICICCAAAYYVGFTAALSLGQFAGLGLCVFGEFGRRSYLSQIGIWVFLAAFLIMLIAGIGPG